MDSVTIDIDDELARLLRMRADQRGHSLEEEAREIIHSEILRIKNDDAYGLPNRSAGVEPDAHSSEEVARRVAAMRALGKRRAEPFDLKALRDELWGFVD